MMEEVGAGGGEGHQESSREGKVCQSPQNRTEPRIFQELRVEKESEGKGGLT